MSRGLLPSRPRNCAREKRRRREARAEWWGVHQDRCRSSDKGPVSGSALHPNTSGVEFVPGVPGLQAKEAVSVNSRSARPALGVEGNEAAGLFAPSLN